MATAVQPVTIQPQPQPDNQVDAALAQATGLSASPPSWWDNAKQAFQDFHTLPSLEFDKKYGEHSNRIADFVRNLIPFGREAGAIDAKIRGTKLGQQATDWASAQAREAVQGMAQPGSFGAPTGAVAGLIEGEAKGALDFSSIVGHKDVPSMALKSDEPLDFSKIPGHQDIERTQDRSEPEIERLRRNPPKEATPKTPEEIEGERKRQETQEAEAKLKGSEFLSGVNPKAKDVEELKKVAPRVAGGFYSHLEHVVQNLPQQKMSGEQLMNTLTNQGVSKRELEWAGISDLAKQGSLNKDEVLAHVQERAPKIETVEKSSKIKDERIEAADKAAQSKEEELRAKLRQDLGVNDTKAHTILSAIEDNISITGDVLTPRSQAYHSDSIYDDPKNREWIKAHKQELLDYVELGRGAGRARAETEGNQPKYESYTLPGGTNYREVLLQLPEQEAPGKFTLAQRNRFKELLKLDREGEISPYQQNEFQRLQKISDERVIEPYEGPHFDEPNVVTHLRLKDRTDVNGKKTLFIEELQSDWARELRENKDTQEAIAEARRTGEGSAPNEVPSMPFDKTWHELALKKAIDIASKEGYDQIAWTTGEQQAERYNLRNYFDNLELKELGDGELVLRAREANSPERSPYHAKNISVTRENLAQYVGKDNAKELLNGLAPLKDYPKYKWSDDAENFIDADTGEIAEHDRESHIDLTKKPLAMGGEHHLALYDRMVPQFLNRYAKRWGAQVGETQVKIPSKSSATYSMAGGHPGEQLSKKVEPGGLVKVQALPVTPAMRQGVEVGQQLIGSHQLDFSSIQGHVAHDEFSAVMGPDKKGLELMKKQIKEATPEAGKAGISYIEARTAPKNITTPTETFTHRAPTKPLEVNQSTEEAWRTGEAYQPERATWHDQVIDSFLKGKKPSGKKPQAIVLGGGQASGKTTLSKKLIGDGSNIVRIDADEIKLLIPEYEKLKETDPKTAAALVHEESSYIAKRIMARAAANKLDVVYDATSSGSGGISMVQTLAKEGYDVHLRFADVSIDEARKRAEIRSSDAGDPANYQRHAPPGALEESHRKSASNYIKMNQMPEVQTAQLYDTSGDSPRLVHSRESIGKTVIHDTKIWGKYSEKASGKPSQLMDTLQQVKKIVPEGQTSHWALLADNGHQGVTDVPFAGEEKKIADSMKSYAGQCKVGFCYMNAQRLATSREALNNPAVKYIEGLVTVHGVPLEHAWLEINGKVYDPTLLDKLGGKPKGKIPMPEYVGVEVPKDMIMKHQYKTGHYSPLSMHYRGDEKTFEKIWGVKPSWGKK